MNTTEKAKKVIKLLEEDEQPIESVMAMFPAPQEWYKVSNKAYNLRWEMERKDNKADETKPHVSRTTNSQISDIFQLNELLSNYAVGVPISATMPELEYFSKLAANLPASEQSLMNALEKYNMDPRWRAIQQAGPIRTFDIFSEFAEIVDASLQCYYNENYISCFLTLVPVIEGVLLRWQKFSGSGNKPEFEEIRKFFKKSAERQPCPYNIQFHKVFSQVCDKILNAHFYKPTDRGGSHSDFNRHLASHLLRPANFGTKNNCIRIFILLDFMTEIYMYEKKGGINPRFELKEVDFLPDINRYVKMLKSAEAK